MSALIECACEQVNVSTALDPPESQQFIRGRSKQNCPLHGWPEPQPIRILLTDALAALEMCGARECYLGERWRHCRTSTVCDRLARLAERIEAVLDGSGSIQVP